MTIMCWPGRTKKEKIHVYKLTCSRTRFTNHLEDSDSTSRGFRNLTRFILPILQLGMWTSYEKSRRTQKQVRNELLR